VAQFLRLPQEEPAVHALARGTVVAIGNFDGVHRGHQAMIGEAAARARELGVAVCALTFDPHPADVVGKGAPPRLATLSRRVALLGQAGADLVVARTFDRAFAAWSPERFARELLSESLHAKLVLVGENFHFGAKRAGDRTKLRELGAALGLGPGQGGFDVAVHAIAGDESGPFSSTRAREAIVAGDLASAERVLGRRHSLSGFVAHGSKIGRTLGYPTANLAAIEEALPADGIYAALVDELAPDGSARALAVAAVSIGVRPSIDGATGRTVEAYLLDLDRDLYGATLRVHFVARLRGEEKFATLDELKAQIARDVEEVRAICVGIGRPVSAAGAYG
jgi:riboflavin kinase/FMN adenylyltransferase